MNLEQIRIDRELTPMEIQRYLYRVIKDLQQFSSEVETDVVRSDEVDVGNYVGGIETEYNLSTSSSTPNGTWDTTMPTPEAGKYIWVRQKIRFTDGSFTTTAATVKYSDIYPVGSIYVSVDSTSPASLFGGTWEQIKDTFLLASGTAYTAGSTGGEATHTLSKTELPHLTGSFQSRQVSGTNVLNTYPANESGVFSFTDNGGDTWGNQIGSVSTATNANALITYDNGGTDSPHNNMPPYLAVYVWKRIA